MTQISRGGNVVTLINVFTVEPKNQQRLLDLLAEATKAVMNGMPGFVSANLHKSLDGTKVVNYAQWQSREEFEAMFDNAEAAAHMREAEKIAEKIEPHLYEVSFVDEGLPIASSSGSTVHTPIPSGYLPDCSKLVLKPTGWFTSGWIGHITGSWYRRLIGGRDDGQDRSRLLEGEGGTAQGSGHRVRGDGA
jgi:heme-degrading monooxygenase HmoA